MVCPRSHLCNHGVVKAREMFCFSMNVPYELHATHGMGEANLPANYQPQQKGLDEVDSSHHHFKCALIRCFTVLDKGNWGSGLRIYSVDCPVCVISLRALLG